MKKGWFKPMLALSCYAALASAAQGEEVIIEARKSIANVDGQYAEEAGNWQNSSVHTTAPGTTAGVGSRWNTTAGSSIILTPNLQEGGEYLFEAAFPAPSSQSADMKVSIILEGATLTDLSTNTTLNGDVLESSVFQRGAGSIAVWRPIGKLVLDPGVSVPSITFTHISGDISNATTSRFYSDSFRFVNAGDPCLAGLPTLTTVNGPLAAGQTFVRVPGVATNASKITVYADGVQIGQKTSGILGGTNMEEVVTTALVGGQIITVTQHNENDVEGCRPETGPVVGSGANPPVRVAFSLRMDPALTGPVGSEGTSASTWLWMLGASGPSAGFGTAPIGGAVLQPGTCWQTVTFDYGFDMGYTWAGAAAAEPVTYAILDSISFSMEEPFDTGPYEIYIDAIMNGSTLIEDFEGQTNGTVAYLFTLPNFSGSTSPNLLSQPPGTAFPNVTVVTNSNASSGQHSTLVSWQFQEATPQAWLRLPLAGAGRRNPVVDLSQPISVRFLALPVGESAAALQVSSIGNVTNAIGDNVTIAVNTIKGSGPFTYQWKTNGVEIENATSSALVLNNVQMDASGTYSVVVSDGTCTVESFGTLTVSETAVSPELNYTVEGNTLRLTWNDSQAVLQSATVLTGSDADWSDVETASSPYEVDISTGTRFFRLKR
ncbi:MAG: hypothetical protein ACO1QB_14660 [Verrucomicrobiales bacterium]